MHEKLSIYEPSHCCTTGITGVGLDADFLRLPLSISVLEQNGIAVERFTITASAHEFVKNETVCTIMATEGPEALPVVLVDNHLFLKGRYPTNEELAQLFAIPKGKFDFQHTDWQNRASDISVGTEERMGKPWC